MARVKSLHPCPHCGKEMHAGAMVRHAPMCIKNPVVFARCRSALTNPLDGERGITLAQYNALRATDDSLPERTTLKNMTGRVLWCDVLAAFGLLSPNEKNPCPHCGKEYLYSVLVDHVAGCKAARPKVPKQPKPVKLAPPKQPKPRTPKSPTACPQCGIRTGKLSLHVCPESPAIAAWLAQNLPNPSRPGYIIVQTDYDAIEHKPLWASALKRAYGSWAGLARRYGLQCQPSRGSTPGMKTGGIPGMDPASRVELHRLADLLHGGDFGPSFSEYSVHAEDAPLTASGLEKRFGTWGAVLAAADLRHGSRSEYHHAANARRKAHQRPQNERRGRGSFDRGDEPISRDFTGIPVLPNPRMLSSGGVAWTVR